jgi:hypothetical protein
VSVTLTGSTAFSKTADTCTGASLPPGRSCRISVGYVPTAAGTSDTAVLTADMQKTCRTQEPDAHRGRAYSRARLLEQLRGGNDRSR